MGRLSLRMGYIQSYHQCIGLYKKNYGGHRFSLMTFFGGYSYRRNEHSKEELSVTRMYALRFAK